MHTQRAYRNLSYNEDVHLFGFCPSGSALRNQMIPLMPWVQYKKKMPGPQWESVTADRLRCRHRSALTLIGISCNVKKISKCEKTV